MCDFDVFFSVVVYIIRIGLMIYMAPYIFVRCLLLVLEQSRVEVAVLLNELAYLKYEASKSSSSVDETIRLKQQNIAISFSLVEKIIKLISSLGENEGMP